jgi:DNA-binding transcriptional ArsR family regulator
MRRDVFQAIADPTRREILHLIATKPLNVNTVAEKFDMSRAAIYKHMKILSECGLLNVKQQGRERICQAELKQLKTVSTWIDQYRIYWEQKFDSLDQYLKEIQTAPAEIQKSGDKKKSTKKTASRNK